MLSRLRNAERRGALKVGSLVLGSAIATVAFGADAPAPSGPSSPKGECQCPGGDMDVAKIQERAAKLFGEVDTNHDGKITYEEFAAFKPEHGGWRGPGMMMGGPMMG